ncbi:hypothetical protein POTOM_044230 [Populus tomentosa]|uniref:Uncharacterized protein n=1 Tax=Populus tomentosa TaxID=118781 RepID=A0A8X8CEB5_POPTO|nr:hypothetical protein POTOM_044230 [Populus tomentosa]
MNFSTLSGHHSRKREEAGSSKNSLSMTMASSSSATGTNLDLMKKVRSHEVAIAELSNLSSSRTVYQKNGNLFFRTTAQKATASEQSKRSFHVHSRLIFQCSPCNSNNIAFVYLICEYCIEQLDSAKAKLEG